MDSLYSDKLKIKTPLICVKENWKSLSLNQSVKRNCYILSNYVVVVISVDLKQYKRI